ncbi:hypothetical protein NY2A_b731L [Paramecium bursaria Chlorella virus NY2A]|uniref:Uncharacterized protein b731L n=1 Tax=Paramecium bursaria Chlorella virus NY2A TaxID=46021 RepID=A7IXQ6_PBCVN|nr:hypothetical protein NY2A_b731L [Paramecium bursaria Chlorella virus NY2A]ABT15130.1 hypothetical protein NY2A_b731L [Paramecium bursaria Chlorella virus NY2A]
MYGLVLIPGRSLRLRHRQLQLDQGLDIMQETLINPHSLASTPDILARKNQHSWDMKRVMGRIPRHI